MQLLPWRSPREWKPFKRRWKFWPSESKSEVKRYNELCSWEQMTPTPTWASGTKIKTIEVTMAHHYCTTLITHFSLYSRHAIQISWIKLPTSLFSMKAILICTKLYSEPPWCLALGPSSSQVVQGEELLQSKVKSKVMQSKVCLMQRRASSSSWWHHCKTLAGNP